MKVRELFGMRSRPGDPAESWEIPYTELDGGFYFRGNYAAHPYVPRKPDELPRGALESLEGPCGVEDLSQILIIPSSVRLIGLGNRKVITPLEVLAVGARAVGLWTATPQPGPKAIIPLADLAAVEDVHILLYGRLSFLSPDQRLTIRYNTVCRRVLEPPLQALRKRLAGPGRGLLQRCTEPPELPFKWSFLLAWPFSTLDPMAPRDFRFLGAPPRQAGWMQRGHLLILTPWELVSMHDPAESSQSYGVDCFFLARSRIQAVAIQKKVAEVTANGARFVLPMAPQLLTGMAAWFPGKPSTVSQT
jgi:hypothetical protein